MLPDRSTRDGAPWLGPTLGVILEKEGKKESDGRVLHLPTRAQVALMATPPELQVTARRRNIPAGTYSYRITESDDPTWFEESANPYPTREAALATSDNTNSNAATNGQSSHTRRH
jgi:hypothetical protein